MTRLEDTLLMQGLEGRFELSGRWATLRGERCAVFVVEAANGEGYYTWCDDPGARALSFTPSRLRLYTWECAAPRVRRGAGFQSTPLKQNPDTSIWYTAGQHVPTRGRCLPSW